MSKQTPCCGGSRGERILSRLGSCAKCIRLSALGTVVAWVGYGLLLVLFPRPPAQVLALLLALSFTLLFLAHVSAFVLRFGRTWKAETSQSGGDIAARVVPDRRGFLIGATAGLGALLLAPLARLFGAESIAQHSPPHSPPKHDPCAGKCKFKWTVILRRHKFTFVTSSGFLRPAGSTVDGCAPSIDEATGSLEIKQQGQAGSCKITDVEDFQNPPAGCEGVTTEGLSVLEADAKDKFFELIDLKGAHRLRCAPSEKDCKKPSDGDGECKGDPTTERARFHFKAELDPEKRPPYKITTDGEVTKGDVEPDGNATFIQVTWEKVLDCKATCQ
jgi:hypothetical protein